MKRIKLGLAKTEQEEPKCPTLLVYFSKNLDTNIITVGLYKMVPKIDHKEPVKLKIKKTNKNKKSQKVSMTYLSNSLRTLKAF